MNPSAERYAALLDASPDAILEMDADGRILVANAAASAVLRRPDEGIVGLQDTDLFKSRVARDRFVEVCRREGGVRNREVALLSGEGGEFTASVNARWIEAKEGGHMVVTIRDVTEQKGIQARIMQQEKMASIGLLAAGVAHEFNNIMATIYGFAQLAETKEKFRDELVRTVLHYSRRAREITESLLSFSREKPQVFELADVVQVLEDVVHVIEKELENDNIRLVRDYGPVPPTLLNVGKIEEVFLNLLINARQAITRDGTITIGLDHDGTNIFVRFTDTGCGIPKENLRRIFEPFFTTKGSFGGGEIPGTGLGLSVSYNIMLEHKGDILAESEVGRGTGMTVRIPIREERRKRKVETPLELERRSAILVGRRHAILAVDDEAALLELLAGILERHDVVPVNSGREAVEAYRKNRYDYVILDVVMPGELDGFRTFDEIKQIDADARIIILTGVPEEGRLLLYRRRAFGYLRKPFGIKDLSRLIP